MIYWKLEEKKFDLIYNWKISRNESQYKNLFFTTVSDGKTTGTGEASPNIRYEETPDRLHREFQDFLGMQPGKALTIKALTSLLDELQPANALRFAIESAFIHFLCMQQRRSLYDFLHIPPPGDIYTSYTIPIIQPGEVKDFIDRHRLRRFKSIKIKTSDEGLDLIEEVEKNYEGPLRIDANEAWKDVEKLLGFMEKLRGKNIDFIEQPLPHHMEDEYRYLKQHAPFPLMADESVTRNPDMENLSLQFHGINMKLMKAGGYLHGRDILLAARQKGLKTMIGCMIETTLGITSGMKLCGLADYADLDGSFVIGKEPFGLMKEQNGKLEFA